MRHLFLSQQVQALQRPSGEDKVCQPFGRDGVCGRGERHQARHRVGTGQQAGRLQLQALQVDQRHHQDEVHHASTQAERKGGSLKDKRTRYYFYS